MRLHGNDAPSPVMLTAKEWEKKQSGGQRGVLSRFISGQLSRPGGALRLLLWGLMLETLSNRELLSNDLKVWMVTSLPE